ncbi:hypothetical protein H1C71_029139, partial [Ictidomys tridecemlineatus]
MAAATSGTTGQVLPPWVKSGSAGPRGWRSEGTWGWGPASHGHVHLGRLLRRGHLAVASRLVPGLVLLQVGAAAGGLLPAAAPGQVLAAAGLAGGLAARGV